MGSTKQPESRANLTDPVIPVRIVIGVAGHRNLENYPTLTNNIKSTIPGSRCSVQELFTYNPEKAKQLLAEAGYPDGFKAEVICTPANTDYLAILLADSEKVGISLEIRGVEGSLFFSAWFGRAYDMIFSGASATSSAQFHRYLWVDTALKESLGY